MWVGLVVRTNPTGSPRISEAPLQDILFDLSHKDFVKIRWRSLLFASADASGCFSFQALSVLIKYTSAIGMLPIATAPQL